jgi:TRAP-type C4-dicarboxylate transport system substrate-binding protein
MVRHKTLAPLALLSAGILLAGCAGGDADSPDDDANSPDDVAETTTLTFANSFTDDHPHNRCGAIMIADEINAMDVGLQIDVFSNSSLGPDADSVSSLIAGDIDIFWNAVTHLILPASVLGFFSLA